LPFLKWFKIFNAWYATQHYAGYNDRTINSEVAIALSAQAEIIFTIRHVMS
jgi:hypothetical protein